MTHHPVPTVYRVMIALGQVLFGALRLRPAPVGLEHIPASGGAVLAITHFGYLDFALAQWVLWRRDRRWIRFLTTVRAFEHPVSGPLLRAMRHIPVDRDSGAGGYRASIEALRDGHLVGVFPEGRVTGTWQVLPCAGGAARMAAAAGVPLIPIAVWGGHRVLTRTHRFSLRAAAGATISVRVGEPLHVPRRLGDEAGPWLREHLVGLMDEAQRSYRDRPRRRQDDWWQHQRTRLS